MLVKCKVDMLVKFKVDMLAKCKVDKQGNTRADTMAGETVGWKWRYDRINIICGQDVEETC